MPESNAEKIRRLATELARIRNQLRELVSEQAGDEMTALTSEAAITMPAAVPETIIPAPHVVPVSPAAAPSATAIEDFSPPHSDDPLEEILKASPPQAFKGAEPEDDDVVVVDISLPPGKPAQSNRQVAAHESTAAQDAEPGATGSSEQPEPHSDKPPAKNYLHKPPPRKRK